MSIQERMAELNNLLQSYIFYAILPNNLQKKRYLISHFNISQIFIVSGVVVALSIAVGTWWHRRKVQRLSFRLDEDARRISELRTSSSCRMT